MLGRRAAWIARVIAVAVTLVLAHDLTFLARYGSAFGEALVHAGHGQAWTNAVLVSLSLGAGLVLAAAIQLWRLRAAADGSRPGTIARSSLRELARSWATLAARLAGVVVVLLTVQENLERALIGIRAADPAILVSADYPGAPGIVAAVSIAVSFVVAIYRWRRDALLARIRATIAPRRRLVPARRPARRSDGRPASILGRSLALRAPPARAAITIPA